MPRTRAASHRHMGTYPTSALSDQDRSLGAPISGRMPTTHRRTRRRHEHTRRNAPRPVLAPAPQKHRGHSGPYLPIKMCGRIHQAPHRSGCSTRSPASPQACAHTIIDLIPMSAATAPRVTHYTGELPSVSSTALTATPTTVRLTTQPHYPIDWPHLGPPWTTHCLINRALHGQNSQATLAQTPATTAQHQHVGASPSASVAHHSNNQRRVVLESSIP